MVASERRGNGIRKETRKFLEVWQYFKLYTHAVFTFPFVYFLQCNILNVKLKLHYKSVKWAHPMIDQWFSVGGSFCLLGNIRQCLETSLIIMTGEMMLLGRGQRCFWTSYNTQEIDPWMALLLDTDGWLELHHHRHRMTMNSYQNRKSLVSHGSSLLSSNMSCWPSGGCSHCFCSRVFTLNK